MTRRAARIDRNQPEIVNAFRRLGCSVAITSMMGDGFTDLVVGRAGKTILAEVKDPQQPPSKRKLTPAQVKFHGSWLGIIVVIETVDDTIAAAARYL